MGNIKSVYVVLRMGNEDPSAVCIFKSNAEKIAAKERIDGFDSWVEEWELWESRGDRDD